MTLFLCFFVEEVQRQQAPGASYEQRQRANTKAEQIYTDLVDDNRCDLSCHRACANCGRALLESAEEAFSIKGLDTNSNAKWLLLPCGEASHN